MPSCPIAVRQVHLYQQDKCVFTSYRFPFLPAMGMVLLRASLCEQYKSCFVKSHQTSALTRVSRDFGEVSVSPGLLSMTGESILGTPWSVLVLASPKFSRVSPD